MKHNFHDEDRLRFQLSRQIDKAYVYHQVIRFLCKHGYIEPLEGDTYDLIKSYRFRVLTEFRVGDYLYVIGDRNSIRSMRALENRIRRLK